MELVLGLFEELLKLFFNLVNEKMSISSIVIK